MNRARRRFWLYASACMAAYALASLWVPGAPPANVLACEAGFAFAIFALVLMTPPSGPDAVRAT